MVCVYVQRVITKRIYLSIVSHFVITNVKGSTECHACYIPLTYGLTKYNSMKWNLFNMVSLYIIQYLFNIP